MEIWKYGNIEIFPFSSFHFSIFQFFNISLSVNYFLLRLWLDSNHLLAFVISTYRTYSVRKLLSSTVGTLTYLIGFFDPSDIESLSCRMPLASLRLGNLLFWSDCHWLVWANKINYSAVLTSTTVLVYFLPSNLVNFLVLNATTPSISAWIEKSAPS